VRAHEEKMDQILTEADPERLIILFPSEESISTDDFARAAQPSFDKGLTVRFCLVTHVSLVMDGDSCHLVEFFRRPKLISGSLSPTSMMAKSRDRIHQCCP